MNNPIPAEAFLQGNTADDRLESWKSIAAYIGRETRTAQRWEISEGLPVHRHIHSKSSSVYAFKHEIDAWLFMRRCFPRNSPANSSEISRAVPTGLESAPPDIAPQPVLLKLHAKPVAELPATRGRVRPIAALPPDWLELRIGSYRIRLCISRA